MAKSSRGRRRTASRPPRRTPRPLLCKHGKKKDTSPRKCPKGLDKKDWKDATCSVCMECPHNAVLLLCSSHNKGCRPYMCGTSLRYSNCLDQYKKAYTKLMSPHGLLSQVSDSPGGKCEGAELACPLCRGQVKGWTVVEPAREFLNSKKRNCMQESCPFVGNYKELRKHVKAEHPSAPRPREVDPSLERKWRRLERERERDDVISTIRSTMPGAMVFGDYVVESNNGLDSDDGEDEEAFNMDRNNRSLDSNMMNVFLLMQAFWQSGNPGFRRLRSFSPVTDSDNNEGDADNGNANSTTLANRLRQHGRALLRRRGSDGSPR